MAESVDGAEPRSAVAAVLRLVCWGGKFGGVAEDEMAGCVRVERVVAGQCVKAGVVGAEDERADAELAMLVVGFGLHGG